MLKEVQYLSTLKVKKSKGQRPKQPEPIPVS